MKQTLALWNNATRELARLSSIAGEAIDHYTSLGVFTPKRARTFVPYAERVAYAGSGRHHASRTRRPFAWLRSLLRDLGDVVLGSFTTPDVGP